MSTTNKDIYPAMERWDGGMDFGITSSSTPLPATRMRRRNYAANYPLPGQYKLPANHEITVNWQDDGKTMVIGHRLGYCAPWPGR